MHKTLLLFQLLLFIVCLQAQGADEFWVPPTGFHSTAFRIEKLKNGEDCHIISYVPCEYNKTITPRDDRNLGVYYLVSGKDCEKCFAETFSTMKYFGEQFGPLHDKTLDLDSFAHINFFSTHDIIDEGYTKLFRTYFWSDQLTSNIPNDDAYLGTDFIIDSADPDAITQPFQLNYIPDEYHDIPALKALFESHSYYKLREMLVNRNLIVENLRKEKKLKDITPKEPRMETVYVKAVKNY